MGGHHHIALKMKVKKKSKKKYYEVLRAHLIYWLLSGQVYCNKFIIYSDFKFFFCLTVVAAQHFQELIVDLMQDTKFAVWSYTKKKSKWVWSAHWNKWVINKKNILIN